MEHCFTYNPTSSLFTLYGQLCLTGTLRGGKREQVSLLILAWGDQGDQMCPVGNAIEFLSDIDMV